jgi:hypothetical protein
VAADGSAMASLGETEVVKRTPPTMELVRRKRAEDCARIAAKTKAKSDKRLLLRLAKRWKLVAAEQDGEVGKSAERPTKALHSPERR